MKDDQTLVESGMKLISSIVKGHPYRQFATFVEGLRRENNANTIDAVLEATKTILEGINEAIETTPLMEDGHANISGLRSKSFWDDKGSSGYSKLRRIYRDLRNDSGFKDKIEQASKIWFAFKGKPHAEKIQSQTYQQANGIIHAYIAGIIADAALKRYQQPDVAEEAAHNTYYEFVRDTLPHWNPEYTLQQMVSRKGGHISTNLAQGLVRQADAVRTGVRKYDDLLPVPRRFPANRRMSAVMKNGLTEDGLISTNGDWYKLNGTEQSGYPFPDPSKLSKEEIQQGQYAKAVASPIWYDSPSDIPPQDVKLFGPGKSFRGADSFWESIPLEMVVGGGMWKGSGSPEYVRGEAGEEQEADREANKFSDQSDIDSDAEYLQQNDTLMADFERVLGAMRKIAPRKGEETSKPAQWADLLQTFLEEPSMKRQERLASAGFKPDQFVQIERAGQKFIQVAEDLGIDTEDLRTHMHLFADASSPLEPQFAPKNVDRADKGSAKNPRKPSNVAKKEPIVPDENVTPPAYQMDEEEEEKDAVLSKPKNNPFD